MFKWLGDLEYKLRDYYWYRKFRDIVWWFRYRLIPWNRYHTMKLHSPGYRDPRSQMINAVMGMVERYIQELRKNWTPRKEAKGLSDSEVVDLYIGWCDDVILNPDSSEDLVFLKRHWRNHYVELKTIITWWTSVKDNNLLDSWSKDEIPFLENRNHYNREELEGLTTEEVDSFLKRAIAIRTGMWT